MVVLYVEPLKICVLTTTTIAAPDSFRVEVVFAEFYAAGTIRRQDSCVKMQMMRKPWQII